MTTMTDIHDSAACTADNGQPCEQCVRASEQERRQQAVKNLAADIELGHMIDRAIDATNAELKAYVSVFTLREALFEVIDAGCTCESGEKHPWQLDDGDDPEWTEDMTNIQRQRFADAVIARAAKLATVHLENLCHRHRVARLPKPTASVCADCKREQDVTRRERDDETK